MIETKRFPKAFLTICTNILSICTKSFERLGVVHVSKYKCYNTKISFGVIICKIWITFFKDMYDKASNIRSECNGLKRLILKENYSAFFIYYFSHQTPIKHYEIAFFLKKIGCKFV